MVLSPFSITTLLALLQQGALGQTQEEITAALQMTSANSASAYSTISQDIKVSKAGYKDFDSQKKEFAERF